MYSMQRIKKHRLTFYSDRYAIDKPKNDFLRLPCTVFLAYALACADYNTRPNRILYGNIGI